MSEKIEGYHAIFRTEMLDLISENIGGRSETVNESDDGRRGLRRRTRVVIEQLKGSEIEEGHGK